MPIFGALVSLRSVAYAELRDLLLARSDVERGNGALDEEIRAAEASLGVLPDDYRRFLREFGWIGVGSDEIFGLGSGVPEYLNVVSVTLEERAEGGLPERLVAVMNDGGGNLSCLDCGELDEADVAPMVLWDHELGPSEGTESIAPSFSHWLVGRLSGSHES